MVKGLALFREYFRDYPEQYVLIGGAACTISFEDRGISFGRTTRDLDIVLIVEAQTKEFAERFWQFICDGRYRIRAGSSGVPRFYRFDKPEDERYPKMLELFSRTNYVLREETGLTPIHFDDEVSSLSAILLNEAYYRELLKGRDIVMGVSILKPEWIIPFKAKAWLDLQAHGADSADIKKHRNDIIRIAAEMVPVPCHLSEEVRRDMEIFLRQFEVTAEELKSLQLRGIRPGDIREVLRKAYIEIDG